VYHLTCPSCEEVTDSSFVRSGAVVRCPACQQKFRIKSSHVERVLHTGPRTLDEGDSLLRSDSVDIDPDEVSPVSIDDEGNVVGLSGLSELMRWSDGKAANKKDRRTSKPQPQDKLQARVAADEQTRSPLDKVIDAATPGPGRPAKRGSRKTGRGRRGKRKRRNPAPLLILAVVIGVLIGGGLVIILINALQQRGTTTPPREPNVAQGQDDTATNPPTPPAPDPDPEPQPNNTTQTTPPGDQPGPGDADTPGPADDTTAPDPDGPTPEPEPEPDTDPDTQTATGAEPGEAGEAGDSDDPAPDTLLGDNGLPLNAPTRLIEGRAIKHEGWYVLDPPRFGNEPVLAEGLSVSEAFKARPFTDSLLLVSGKIKNSAGKAVVRGELHMMLVDARGEVFAETYLPVVMLDDQTERGVSLPINSRYRDRIAEVRVGVKVTEWADRLARVEGAQANAVKHDAGPAVRVSMACPPGEPLDDALIHLRATNEKGALVGQFMVEQRGLGLAPGQWLDLLIATPIDPALKPTEWSARVYRR